MTTTTPGPGQALAAAAAATEARAVLAELGELTRLAQLEDPDDPMAVDLVGPCAICGAPSTPPPACTPKGVLGSWPRLMPAVGCCCCHQDGEPRRCRAFERPGLLTLFVPIVRESAGVRMRRSRSAGCPVSSIESGLDYPSL